MASQSSTVQAEDLFSVGSRISWGRNPRRRHRRIRPLLHDDIARSGGGPEHE